MARPITCHRRHRLITILSLIALVGVSSGCASIMDALRGKGKNSRYARAQAARFTEADVDRAAKAQDWEKVERYCLTLGAGYKPRKKACIVVTDAYANQNKIAKLKEICKGTTGTYKHWYQRRYTCRQMLLHGGSGEMRQFTQATCADLPALYKAHGNRVTDRSKWGKAGADANLVHIAERFIGCKQWSFVWRRMAHLGNRYSDQGGQLLEGLHAKGHKLAREMHRFIRKHGRRAFRFKHANYMTDHFTTFLKRHGDATKCKSWFAAANDAPDKVFGNWNWYFRTVKCQGAERLAAKRLLSARSGTRAGACRTLGVLGGKKHLRKVLILARTDSYSRIKEVRRNNRIWATRIWPVRVACREAAGKIQLRID